MGQEWACSSPFRFFTDHNPQLGRLVTEGRRREFRHFSAFADEKRRETIPDPQALATFEASRLNWEERQREPHRGTWQLYRELVRLRREEPALRNTAAGSFRAWPVGENAIVLHRQAEDGSGLAIVCQLRGAGCVSLADLPSMVTAEVVLSTETPTYCGEPLPPEVHLPEGDTAIVFRRPGAVLLRC